MKTKLLSLLLFPLISCVGQEKTPTDYTVTDSILNQKSEKTDSTEIEEFYIQNKGNSLPSKSLGTVDMGKLENGKLMPYYGENFTYFDQDSYLNSRAYTNDAVKKIILKSYEDLMPLYPERKFFLMELSNKEGGKLYPHKTHQNGLSVDFMMPKLKNNLPDYSLDTLGKQHYFLTFNDNGEYVEDTSIKVDFDLIAKHILVLNENAQKYGFKIGKVIIKVEYKDELFATENGKKLEKSGIYIVKSLSPIINAIHDDHFHIDFEPKL